jgi:hypothetical protein
MVDVKSQVSVPAMTASGGGVIINLGSWIARLDVPLGALYPSTKGATETHTRAWAAEGSEPHPGETMMKGTPAGDVGTPDAIAHAVVRPAGDEAAFVHETVVAVDGGRTGVAVIAAQCADIRRPGGRTEQIERRLRLMPHDSDQLGLGFRLPRWCGLRFPESGGSYVAVDH